MILAARLNPFRLTPLEIATGILFGSVGSAPDLRSPVGTPLEALAAAVLPALLRSPCLVSFSGGRDSSAVLAVAVAVARREGLPFPVPVTNVFPNAAASRESEWQERVIAHLALEDWIRLEHAHELDAVGPVARRVLRRHGLLWPFNVHFHVPLLEAAAGGSLLTGIGGDEVFGQSRWLRAASVLSGAARPVPRDALCVGLALAPAPVRTAVLRRRHELPFPWLRPDARRLATRLWAVEAAREPLRLRPRLAWWRRLRYVAAGLAALDLVASDSHVRVVHPLADAGFLAAFGRLGPLGGVRSRPAAMRAVLGDLLPAALYERATKGTFDEAFWNHHGREFAAAWDGEGVDEELVDVGALREIWSSSSGDAHTLTLLQAAWLMREEARGSAGDRLEELVGGRAD